MTQTEYELYEQWREDYALMYEPNYDEHLEADCKAAFLAGMQASRRAPTEVTSIQMPEPVAYQAEHQSGEWVNRELPTIPSTGIYTGKIRSLYTEHQVRQILAQHSIKVEEE